MDLFNFVKTNVDILDVVGQYTNLKKTGSAYWKARCPFHHENTPSFTVSPHKNMFYCFGCHVTGDAIAFIEKIENIGALEAAHHLVNRYSLQVPQDLDKSFKINVVKQHAQLFYAIATWCQAMFLKTSKAFQYLQQRRIEKLTEQQYMLGFFPSGSQAIAQLLAHIAPLGFTSQDLLDQHILFSGTHGLYSPFENRIVFPIKNHLGQVCGFGGRIFLEQDTRVKYYNSKESEVFKKGKILYGFDLAKSEIQKKQHVFVVEGYMDCIALYQAGFKNVVATLGTACTLEHLQQLAKQAQTIYLLYDADKAGKQAIIRLTTMCWQLDLDVKVVTLPQGHDPASMIEQGLDILDCIQSADDIFDFFVKTKAMRFGQESMKHKMMVVHEMFELVAQVSDGLKQTILLNKIAQSVQISLEIIKKEYTIRYKQASLKSFEKDTVLKDELQSDLYQSTLQDQIFVLVFHNPALLIEKYEILLQSGLTGDALVMIEKIIAAKKVNNNIDAIELRKLFNVVEYEKYITLGFALDTIHLEQLMETLMRKFQKKHWKTLAEHIKIKIMQAQKLHDHQEVQRLIALFEELKVDFK